MTKVESQRLVIDASVARAAGGKDATHPVSKACRDFLIAVYRICHHVVMTADVKREWNLHQSAFARKWRGDMISRRKFQSVDVSTGPAAQFATAAFPAIQDATLSEKQREKVAKDIRLAEAAIATGSRVVSCDEEMRFLLCGLAAELPQLASIVWVNPTRQDDRPIQWLEEGAPDQPHRRISSH